MSWSSSKRRLKAQARGRVAFICDATDRRRSIFSKCVPRAKQNNKLRKTLRAVLPIVRYCCLFGCCMRQRVHSFCVNRRREKGYLRPVREVEVLYSVAASQPCLRPHDCSQCSSTKRQHGTPGPTNHPITCLLSLPCVVQYLPRVC